MDLIRSDDHSFPSPEDVRQAFRAFLQHVREDEFGGSAKKMAETLGYGANQARSVLRIIKGKTDKVDDDLVRRTWDHLYRTRGLDAFRYAPVPLGAFLLPIVTFEPRQADGETRARRELHGQYALDRVEVMTSTPPETPQRFVVPVQTDTMAPELIPGMHIVLEPVPEPRILPMDGIYLFRMEDSIQIRRLQRLPNRRIRVLSTSDRYDPYDLLLDEHPDFQLLGRAWGRFLRIG